MLYIGANIIPRHSRRKFASSGHFSCLIGMDLPITSQIPCRTLCILTFTCFEHPVLYCVQLACRRSDQSPRFVSCAMDDIRQLECHCRLYDWYNFSESFLGRPRNSSGRQSLLAHGPAISVLYCGSMPTIHTPIKRVALPGNFGVLVAKFDSLGVYNGDGQGVYFHGAQG
jgi:hypothetical protein